MFFNKEGETVLLSHTENLVLAPWRWIAALHGQMCMCPCGLATGDAGGDLLLVLFFFLFFLQLWGWGSSFFKFRPRGCVCVLKRSIQTKTHLEVIQNKRERESKSKENNGQCVYWTLTSSSSPQLSTHPLHELYWSAVVVVAAISLSPFLLYPAHYPPSVWWRMDGSHTHTHYITLYVGLPAMRHKGIYRQTHTLKKNGSSVFGACGMPFSMCVAFNLIVKKIRRGQVGIGRMLGRKGKKSSRRNGRSMAAGIEFLSLPPTYIHPLGGNKLREVQKSVQHETGGAMSAPYTHTHSSIFFLSFFFCQVSNLKLKKKLLYLLEITWHIPDNCYSVVCVCEKKKKKLIFFFDISFNSTWCRPDWLRPMPSTDRAEVMQRHWLKRLLRRPLKPLPKRPVLPYQPADLTTSE